MNGNHVPPPTSPSTGKQIKINTKAPPQAPPATTMKCLAESLRQDESMRELHDAVELDLVHAVCHWIHVVLVYGAGAGAVLLYLNDRDLYINPLLVSVFGIVMGRIFVDRVQMTAASSLGFIAAAIVKHALSQGCSASLVPAIYGFVPCAFGFLFRTTRAVVLSTLGVLLATCVIFAVDLSGHCTSRPIGPQEGGYIVADRLVPMLMLILGNGAVIVCIVRQSQESLVLHARAARSAEKLATVRKDVLHRVAHELRTPLNGIVGSVDLLTSSDTLNEHDMENALTIKSCLDTIVDICDNVLMAAKSASNDASDDSSSDGGRNGGGTPRGRRVGAPQPKNQTAFEVASSVESVADIFGAMAELKGLQLRVEYVGRRMQTKVLGMETELRQVLFNLVGNALKFTDTGSITVRVSELEGEGAEADEKGRGEGIGIDMDSDSDENDVLRCLFEVRDTGIGVGNPDTSHMLFEAFHQGEQGGAVSRRHKGTGLGLTICRDLVREMGGEIAVDGNPYPGGVGARFHFTLSFEIEKLAEREPEPEPVPSPESSPVDVRSSPGEDETEIDPRGCRIVIADSERESSTSCLSMVRSLAPPCTTDVRIMPSPSEFLDSVDKEGQDERDDPRRKIAFVGFDDAADTSSMASTLSTLKESGWIVLAHGDHGSFKRLVSLRSGPPADAAYAVFRRPLPLVRMCQKFGDALDGKPPPPPPSSSGDGDGGIPRRSTMSHRATSFPGEVPVASWEDGGVEWCGGSPPRAFGGGGGGDYSTDSVEGGGAPTRVNVDDEKGEEEKGPTRPPAADTHEPGSKDGEKSKAGEPDEDPDEPPPRPGSKMVVVDDTPVNVKVLTKMLSRSTSAPILSRFDGKSAVELVESASRDDVLMFFMDWHMPGLCGLGATESIRRICSDRGGPTVFVCMVTADVDGLRDEMGRRRIVPGGTLSKKGTFTRDADGIPPLSSSSSSSDDEDGHAKLLRMFREKKNPSERFSVVDIVAEKPITFKSTKAILTWFDEQVHRTGGSILDDANSGGAASDRAMGLRSLHATSA